MHGVGQCVAALGGGNNSNMHGRRQLKGKREGANTETQRVPNWQVGQLAVQVDGRKTKGQGDTSPQEGLRFCLGNLSLHIL
jgi:hypothetical protein